MKDKKSETRMWREFAATVNSADGWHRRHTLHCACDEDYKVGHDDDDTLYGVGEHDDDLLGFRI